MNKKLCFFFLTQQGEMQYEVVTQPYQDRVCKNKWLLRCNIVVLSYFCEKKFFIEACLCMNH